MPAKRVWGILSTKWEGLVLDVGASAGQILGEIQSRGGSGDYLAVQRDELSQEELAEIGKKELRLVRIATNRPLRTLEQLSRYVSVHRPVIICHRPTTVDDLLRVFCQLGYVVDGYPGRLATWYPTVLHQIVVSYNRPRQLANVLGDLERDRREWSEVRVWDDRSTADMSSVRETCNRLGFEFAWQDENHGRERFWELWTSILQWLKSKPADHLAVCMSDDSRTCKDFPVRCLEAWNLVAAPDKAVVNVLSEVGRNRQAQWTGCAPRKISEHIWRTQWVDGANLMGHKAMAAVSYRIKKVDPARFRDPTVSSGVWQWFSLELNRKELGIYRVHRSLLVHTIGPSMMHPKVRKSTPLIAANFIDGQQSHDRLQITEPVVASLASMPSRVHILEKVVAGLLPQVDLVRVYLNNYESVPAFLQQSKVLVARSQDHGDLGDAGKFFWGKDESPGYRLTCDDDIVYSAGYVRHMVQGIELYDRRAVVSLHGAVLNPPVESYYRAKRTIHWRGRLDVDVPCHVLGTGVMAYHTSTVTPLIEHFKAPNMADVWMARLCEEMKIPRMCIAHPANMLPFFDTKDSIYDRFKNRDAEQTKAVNEVKWAALPKAR